MIVIKLIFYFLFLIICRKVWIAYKVVNFVRDGQVEVSLEAIISSINFKNLLKEVKNWEKPPAFLFLNKYALKTTHNWLCNTKSMPKVHERVVLVTVDSESNKELQRMWPEVTQLYFPVSRLEVPFGQFTNPGSYLLIYSFRANLAEALARSNQTFWLMQQDTFWRENLFDLNLEETDDYDILVDRVGHDFVGNKRSEFINTALVYIRPTKASIRCLSKYAERIRSWYAPDAGILTMLCATGEFHNLKCTYIPYSICSSWTWLAGDQKNAPTLLQIDDLPATVKIEAMKERFFYFLTNDTLPCNQNDVIRAAKRMESGKVPLTTSTFSMREAMTFIGDYINDNITPVWIANYVRNICSSWTWLAGDQKNAPTLLQIDDLPATVKIEAMKERFFYFLTNDTLPCNQNDVIRAAKRMESGKVPLTTSTFSMREAMTFIGDYINDNITPVWIANYVRKYVMLTHYFAMIWQ